MVGDKPYCLNVMLQIPKAVLCCFAISSIIAAGSENVKIKIVEPPSSTHFQSFSNSAKKLSLRIDPAPLSGPDHFQKLNGECFKGKEKGYEYTVCPFQNVTQKEERSSWNSFHGVLGVWHEWIIENDTLIGMHFTVGERCGLSDRESKVMLNCSTRTKLHSMSEPSTCVYTIWMDTPLACLRGAMQVYHFLTDDQLKAWNTFDDEYIREEITFQGLTKQRKKILMEAGLLRPHTKPSEEKATTNDNALQPKAVSSDASCDKEKEKLQIELNMIQSKVNLLVKGYPAIATILGFVSSNETQAGNDHTPQTEYPTHEMNSTVPTSMNISTQAETTKLL
ncbi:N-acetylglucosamine-1-phosphotransferase subunit gamma-like [Halichondria panicea]|uniref:N-acetylglucosamine-1-phosphotransferase subunit gamma-like n=1 Tax=Halichondria panicea TaxID=6063 RepID=UPI00312B4382